MLKHKALIRSFHDNYKHLSRSKTSFIARPNLTEHKLLAMADSKSIPFGIELEGETLRFFEHLVSDKLASFQVDPKAEKPYAIIRKDKFGKEQIVVHARAFYAADDVVQNTGKVFYAADDA